MTETVFVAADLDGQTVEVGSAYFTRRNNVTTTAFRYDEEYLARPGAYTIDPSMPLLEGNHTVGGLPGAFADCSPDRWGKNLIAKMVRLKALRDSRTAPSVSEVDYLLGVSDLTRQGALRFRTERDGSFLDPDLTVPKLVELPRLLHAADAVEADVDDLAAIKDLLDAGSGSLGGARPKASVRDGQRLLIAKFPHHNDEWDVMGWEKTALDLAERAGIETPTRRLVPVGGRNVLVLDRFDRNGVHRIGYISAMTMVGGRDGVPGDYLEVAETLTEFGSQTTRDLQQLWRRIVFSVAIHNTDDHLRNHGFLRAGPSGWKLSPVFDVNPNPDAGAQRVTGIGGATRQADEVEGLTAYASSFRVGVGDAKEIVREVLDATSEWRQVATGNGVSPGELPRFVAAFDGMRERLERLAG
ncbi:type II toxin-antitoxin system HipA family toxin [Kribbella catacumbae]|uniref:type II toxin-antitoxin system HipA family toxin n=1 Tax=Kribbella catacumbae TaxID=460086 RepID=UPI00036289E4|nr:type II toxin-antitoxin system HipA family toxin [Kribbella catacumbae]